MEPSISASSPIPVVIVLYDFRYMWKDNREIAVKKGEKLLLLEKTNKDWWQVVRPTEKKSFFVPAQYVDILVKGKQEKENYGSHSGFTDDSVLYENLDSLKQNLDLSSLFSFNKADVIGLNYGKYGNKCLQDGSKQKPVPKTRTKVTVNKSPEDSTDKSKFSESDTNHSQSQNANSDKHDKGDKSSKIGVGIAQDFAASSPNDLSVSQGDKKNFRSKCETVAVENKVYCNVPVGGGKNNIGKQRVNSSASTNQIHIDPGKNRMKNSYNLKTKPVNAVEASKKSTTEKPEVKHCSISSKNDKLLLSQQLSKSLEKLAEEIQFEPRKVKAAPTNLTSSVQSKSKPTKMPKETLEKKTEKKGKTADASVVLNEKIQPQSRSMFSRFRRSLHHSSSFKANNLKKLGKAPKEICELSLSWEGGLDKIQEKKECEEKPQVTPMGLQRSRTFMFAERSPLAVRPTNKVFTRKHRLDTAYHSQRKPDEKVTLSTFKPIFTIDITNKLDDITENKTEKDFVSGHSLDKDKTLANIVESVAEEKRESINKKDAAEPASRLDKKCSKSLENKNYQTVAIPKDESSSPLTRQKGLTLCNEPYSNSESEDNLEEKSLTNIANKALRSQSSIDSNITASEGTEASDSDENSSLEFLIEQRSHINQQPSNKRRTSLVRSSRVESSKVRKITARLPSTPPLDQKPVKDLGDGWGQYISKGGRCYYYNEKTGEKNWKPPRKTLEKPFIGSRESISSDANRSNTSSPLNENYLQNSLKSSDGSLHSKSSVLETTGPDIPKSSSLSRWKEDSPDDVNRSSCNSSPVTGLSQSSYSLNKSSRDSLNRFSPVDNIPSEEEGFELLDHVYQDDSSRTGDNKSRNEGGGSRRSKENLEISTFRIKPGWEEFYDENLDQIFYVHKNRNEKWILSFDSEERAYFFEETSKKSLWALPDYSSEGFKPDSNFLIQRSATESAISNEIESKLRQKKDVGKSGRISASTRSSKTQSMLIEPKFDISAKDGSKTYSMPRDLSKIYGEIIRLGILNKTKICENGKKLRKNWTPAFAVLSESYLFFFKDAKSFKNMKNIISSNGNHMCLTLQGAVIEKGDKISSRKNVYKISSSDNTEILIQTEKTAEAEEWFKDISLVIQKLPREPCANRISPLLEATPPSKVGLTKFTKGVPVDKRGPDERRNEIKHSLLLLALGEELRRRSIAEIPSLTYDENNKENDCQSLKKKLIRNKDTGSMEDLTFTPEERQNKIKARLKKFFIRRPTVDSLKKKGIWKDEPVFGCSLEHITKNRNPRVPVFVEKCIECIESKEENMKTDGLYRASGNLSQVQKIRLEVDQNNLSIMKDEEDVHVLTGSLKLFFRELKEPLIPSKQLEPALLATDKQVRKERIKDFQKIVKSLPTPNYDTLKFLLQHLLRVKEYHKFNRMNINNLAIVFGPTLMWPEQESANMALELMQQNVVIECLLKEFHEIFT